jgi:hypothetical protein
MAGFKFQPMGVLSFPITNEKDELIKLYEVKVGSENFLQLITEKGAAIMRSADKLGDGEYKSLLESIKDFIDLVFGAGEFDFLYDKFERNPFAMLALVAAVTKLGKSEMESKLSAYV